MWQDQLRQPSGTCGLDSEFEDFELDGCPIDTFSSDFPRQPWNLNTGGEHAVADFGSAPPGTEYGPTESWTAYRPTSFPSDLRHKAQHPYGVSVTDTSSGHPQTWRRSEASSSQDPTVRIRRRSSVNPGITQVLAHSEPLQRQRDQSSLKSTTMNTDIASSDSLRPMQRIQGHTGPTMDLSREETAQCDQCGHRKPSGDLPSSPSSISSQTSIIHSSAGSSEQVTRVLYHDYQSTIFFESAA